MSYFQVFSVFLSILSSNNLSPPQDLFLSFTILHYSNHTFHNLSVVLQRLFQLFHHSQSVFHWLDFLLLSCSTIHYSSTLYQLLKCLLSHTFYTLYTQRSSLNTLQRRDLRHSYSHGSNSTQRLNEAFISLPESNPSTFHLFLCSISSGLGLSKSSPSPL